MASVRISYSLNPPAGVSAPGLDSSGQHKLLVSTPFSHDADAQAAYYTALRSTIAEARAKLGDDLTAWRDAVGKKEVEKEKAQQIKAAEENEEEEEEEI
jgi:hypothetical protein